MTDTLIELEESAHHSTYRRFMRLLNKRPIIYHITFWSLYFLFNVLRWGAYFNDYSYSFQSNLIGFPINIFECYFHSYFLLTFFVFRKKYFSYFVTLFGMLFVMMILRVELNYYLVTPIVFPEAYKPIEKYSFIHSTVVMLGDIYVIGFTTAIKLVIDWAKNQKLTKELEKKTLETELDFLRSQVQPHFFFNTLNNLYALVLRKSDRAPEVILKLSDLMSYILYDINKTKKSSLLKELSYIQNYLDLEQLRFGKRVKINMELAGEMDDKFIPPLILLPFIENAFKHGVQHQTNQTEISIKISVTDDKLHFEISNPKYQAENVSLANQLEHTPKTGGIGLTNTKRRLELLYQDRFELQIDDENNLFFVSLKIPTL
ncbi:sensor histidine kinase [Sediminitomix flava]|nr:histidine kinase [Sediminitomix flava]